MNTKEGKLIVKLCDFGISQQINTNSTYLTLTKKGTLCYMPPESFNGEINCYTDVYAIGCILYELLTEKRPFEEIENENALLLKISKVELFKFKF